MKFCVRLLNSYHIPGLQIPEWHKSLTGAQQLAAAKLAEELGYWRIKVSEHYVIPRKQVALSGDFYLHAATALAAVGGATQRIKLSSSITILPLINLFAQAKIWSTLDRLSDGRTIMVAGVGWLKEEFDLMGVNYHERGAICDEYLEALLQLWTSDHPTYEGKYVTFRDVGFAPKPVQQPFPIWFGGDAPAVLRRIARFGTGWQPFQTPAEKLPEAMDFIRSHKDYKGQPLALEYSMINLMLREGHVPHDRAAGEGSWNAEHMLEIVGQLRELGVTETALQPPPLESYEAYLDWLRWGAEEVMAKAG